MFLADNMINEIEKKKIKKKTLRNKIFPYSGRIIICKSQKLPCIARQII